MEPFMRRMVGHSGEEFWVVEGLGMQFVHRQRWQAEVKLHYLQSSAGVSTAADPLLDQGSSTAGAGTS
jgi:hypothetical protein